MKKQCKIIDKRELRKLPYPHETPYLERFSKVELVNALMMACEESYVSHVIDTDSIDSVREEYGSKETWQQLKYEEWLTFI